MSYPATIVRCHHVKVNGTLCGSPALRRRRYCYFHQQWREQRLRINTRARRHARNLDLPVLEDANSIQITLMQVMRLILTGQIDGKTAGLLLYALQTASVNLKHTDFEPAFREKIVIDPRDIPNAILGEALWDRNDFEEEEEEEEQEEDDDATEEDATEEEEAEPAPAGRPAKRREALDDEEEEDDDDDEGLTSAEMDAEIKRIAADARQKDRERAAMFGAVPRAPAGSQTTKTQATNLQSPESPTTGTQIRRPQFNTSTNALGRMRTCSQPNRNHRRSQ
jgi:hypothetical protein